ncbi:MULTISPECIES: AAA family ATPase [Streptomyces]|uniref:2-phosphoglycerate kinase n=2 Tax=Streptomyces TaxID=1883 RepID=A0ABT9KSB6_9ACTN|nr:MULTISPECIES: AAA family ATPase [Streptomyces]ABC42558.1 putative phosphotransferase [Streptomyces hygroscopicus]MBW8086534.1 AAA family ATPase [Streptomyces hygroscopicus subsp. hygroscopicus]MCO8305993.1 AAA family ATPase [Streptomyces sp. RKCA744]MDN3057187.1 AAA family ATPase [Streptomyces sp. SRF1]MDP9611321.1 2-phosphoglycerate kinase [Streptomyces demainii]
MPETSFQGQVVDTTPASDAFLVIGIPGSGKSSVSAELARRFPLGAHIEGDHLQDLIVSGGHLPSPEEDLEADRQLLLRARNASVLARSFHAAGVVPVIDDTVVRRAHLEFYLEHLKDLPLRLIVLAPSAEVVARRVAERDKVLADDWSFLDEALRTELAGEGTWFDSSTMTLEETVEAILANG